jgi:hypothetical protein
MIFLQKYYIKSEVFTSNAMANVINADKTMSYKDGDFTGLGKLRQLKYGYIYQFFANY